MGLARKGAYNNKGSHSIIRSSKQSTAINQTPPPQLPPRFRCCRAFKGSQRHHPRGHPRDHPRGTSPSPPRRRPPHPLVQHAHKVARNQQIIHPADERQEVRDEV